MNAPEFSSINHANAAHSTGPKTRHGKQRASMNALKHGLTGQRLILQPYELDVYRELSAALNAELHPKTVMESQLVQKIIDCHTRLNRVAALDNNLLNIGLVENINDPDQGGSEDTETECAAAQARSWIAQENSFEKLGRYEARLSRQLLAYTKEFERVQSLRLDREHAQRAEQSRDAFTRRAAALREAAGARATSLQLVQTNPPASQSASFCSGASERHSQSATLPETPLAA